jgi:hypothetical protein
MKKRPASERRIWMAASATGWSEPVPGRDFHPQSSSAFPRRTVTTTTGKTTTIQG